MQRLSVAAFCASSKTPLVVVLDDVRSMHNVGSVLRTADAFRLQSVVMCGITSTPPHPELHKTALGAEDAVSWHHASDVCAELKELKARGYRLIALEQCEGSVLLQNVSIEPSERIALVIGNEVHGVSQEAIDLCDDCVEIPQLGTKHSLNVSVAAGISIWQIFQKLTLALLLTLFSLQLSAQELIDTTPIDLETLGQVMPTWHIKKKPEWYKNEWIPVIVLPEISIYAPLKFKNEKQRQKYTRLVINVKKTLPLAKDARRLMMETYEVMQLLPNEKARKAHLENVEKDIKRIYTPKMKKLTFSQGKLLIKLIDRECKQSSYEIVQAFLGPTKAFFYQVFAWTFRASLKKTYDPEGDDAMVERICRQIESGAI